MPIYEYRCSDCGHRLEALQRLADSPLLVCPSCGKESLVKLISAVGFQLKGSGWYATDFKNSGAKPADKASAESGGDASSGTKGESGEGAAASSAKSDTKPAAPATGGESKAASAETKAPAADSAKPAAKPAATGS